MIVEPEVPDRDAPRRKVRNDEPVLLDRFQILFHLKMAGYRGADATEYREVRQVPSRRLKESWAAPSLGRSIGAIEPINLPECRRANLTGMICSGSNQVRPIAPILFPAGPHSTGRNRRRIIKNSFVDDGNLELAAGIKAIQAAFPASMVDTQPVTLRSAIRLR